MRAVPLIALLCSVTVIGCSTPVSLARTSTASKTIFRAQGDGLTELESAAHTRHADHDDKTRARPAKSSTRCQTCNRETCTCSGQTSLTGQLVFTTLSAPFSLPAMLVGDNYDHFTEFPDYPYADDAPGSVLINSEFQGKKQSYSGTLQTFAIPGSSDLDRFGARLLLENADRIGIDTETDYWLQTHRQGGPDHAWLGDFNLVYRFAESEHVQWRAGVGFNWLSDQTQPEFGVNFTYGFDWFPCRPWTISSVIDWGTIGGSTMFHNRTSVGVRLGPAELFAGYDYFQLGTANFHGPVAGLGYRF